LALNQTETTRSLRIAVMVSKMSGCRMLCEYVYLALLNVWDQSYVVMYAQTLRYDGNFVRIWFIF
jgi:hypothetical protein